MRIIGGKHRSRKLNMVGKPTTRETADMVKESVFNMLGGTVNGVVLDLFAGSGAYALEAISRGASHANCVDSNMDAISTIKKNASLLNETNHLTAILRDYQKYLSSLSTDLKFDLIFLDPPYEMNIYQEVMEKLIDHTHDLAHVVCESQKSIILPEWVGPFQKIKEKTYGIKRISIYEKEALL